MPVISVLMPVYNAELYIKEAIESILNQSFTDFEFLIYNDGSTDKTDEIISGFNDARIVYKKVEINAGYISLLNEGLDIAKGKYIARMDSDDIALPNRFEEQFKYLESNLDVGICGSWIEFIGKMSGLNKSSETFDEIQYSLFFGCPLTHPSIMMRRDLIKKYNLKYNQEYYYAEDHYFFAQASLNFKLTNIPLVLLKYRIHDAQIGGKKWKEQFIAKSRIQAKLFSNVLLGNDADLIWLEDFFMEKSIPNEKWLNEITIYQQRIIKDNRITKVYPEAILSKAVINVFERKTSQNFYKYFFNKYYNQKKFSLKLLSSFFKEKYKPHRILGGKLTSYFILKCLIKYKKNEVLAQ